MREPSVSIQMVVAPYSTPAVSNIDISAGAIIADCGPIIPTLYDSRSKLLKAFTKNGKLVRKSHTTLLHAAAIADYMPVFVCRAYDDNGVRGGIVVNKDGTTQPIFKQGDNLFKYKARIKVKDSEVSRDYSSDFCIRLGNIIYYKGTKPNDPSLTGEYKFIEITDEVTSLDSFIEAVNKLTTVTKIFKSGDTTNYELEIWTTEGGIELLDSEKVTPTDLKTYQLLDLQYEYAEINVLEDSKVLFYLFQRYHSDLSYTFSLHYPKSSYSQDEINKNKVIALEVSTNTRNYSYEGSLDPDFLNNFNVNQAIININDYEGIEFEISVPDNLVLENPDYDGYIYKDIPESVEFGKIKLNEITNELSTLKDAVEKIKDSDEVKPTFLCPFGFQNFSYGLYLAEVGSQIYSFVPYGIICDKNDYEAQSNGIIGDGHYNILVMTPHDKSSSITDYIVNLSAEVAYIRRYVQNRSIGRKFAPIMGLTHGSFSMDRPAVTLTKSVREKLLDKGIMSIIYKRSDSQIYLNKNKSISTDKTNVLTEDQNCRIAYQINRDFTEILKQFIGEFNDLQTRNRVINALDSYVRKNILSELYSVNNIRIQCDEQNNTEDIIVSNQLVVDVFVTYNNTIYEIKVFHRAFNLANAPK